MTRNLKRTLALVLALSLALVLAACGGGTASSAAAPASQPAAAESDAPTSTGDSGDDAATGGGNELKVAMLLSGAINDGGWNTMAYNALKAAEEELGAEIAYTENVTQNDQVQLLRQYASKDFTVMIGHGFEYGDALTQVAEEFPDKYFINYGGAIKNGSNLGSINYAYGETGALLGVLVGQMEDVTKVGVIHAFENPTGHQESYNVEKFAKMYNPNIEFAYSYTGDWDDINKAKEAAIAHLNNGCQAIYTDMSGPAGAIVQAVIDADAYFMECTFDAYDLAPDNIISSAVHDATAATLTCLGYVKDGSFDGQVYKFGLEDGVMSMGKMGPAVTPEMLTEMEKVQQEIIDGKAELLILVEED